MNPRPRSITRPTIAMTVVATLFLGALLAPPAVAEDETWKTIFSGTTEVNVVNVEVVVTDRDGHCR